jgi:hypothetical protein
MCRPIGPGKCRGKAAQYALLGVIRFPDINGASDVEFEAKVSMISLANSTELAESWRDSLHQILKAY